jgi:hypothetical protein
MRNNQKVAISDGKGYGDSSIATAGEVTATTVL